MTTGKIITANNLADGLVVFMNAESRWCGDLNGARLFLDADDLARAEEAAARDVAERRVVGVYTFDANQDGKAIAPLHYRERIRAKGPTVRPDLGKQAG
ncbi:MAG: DUF2849 domain-containing protein [Rhodospirillales bacterium]